ncbi:twin-arginine translocation signal domain-containing protein, partial [Candidatus Dojkabacteria bacterium]|nr:twin-arginine translocation signal domain-containing protein [Candidatus Dojkabacteria bacterium]
MNRRQFLKLGAAAAGGLALGACRKAILRTNFSPYEEGHQAWAEAEALRNYVEALINRL